MHVQFDRSFADAVLEIAAVLRARRFRRLIDIARRHRRELDTRRWSDDGLEPRSGSTEPYALLPAPEQLIGFDDGERDDHGGT